MQALYVLGLIVGGSFGAWHFFVPTIWQWYSYIPKEYGNLIVAIDYTNFSFSLLLAGYSLLLIIFRKQIFNKSKELLVMYGFMVLVWFCRVALTFINPWPLEPIAWAAYLQQILVIITFLLQLVPFIYLLKNSKRV